MADRKPFIAGNWKLNCGPREAGALASDIARAVGQRDDVEVAIAPPFVSIQSAAAALVGSNVKIAAQNVYWETKGAFTGEVSPQMLAELGCQYVIVGHSERRTLFAETDATVALRAKAALEAGLGVILCVGETLADRDAGNTLAVVERQLVGGLEKVSDEDASSIVVAYEPVWAIGTGRTATPEQAQDVHAAIRARLTSRFGSAEGSGIRIQYGGSVKPANAADLLSQPDIDGALVGGASLKAESFAGIIEHA